MEVKNWLGYKGKDKVTGFAGIVDHLSLFKSGCRRICLQPPMKEDGTVPDPRFIDEFQVEFLSETPEFLVMGLQKPKFEFGQKVKNTVTEFEGKITGVAWYLNGCIRYEVTAKINKEGFVREKWHYDTDLEIVGEVKPISNEPRKTGGTCSGTSKMPSAIF